MRNSLQFCLAAYGTAVVSHIYLRLPWPGPVPFDGTVTLCFLASILLAVFAIGHGITELRKPITRRPTLIGLAASVAYVFGYVALVNYYWNIMRGG